MPHLALCRDESVRLGVYKLLAAQATAFCSRYRQWRQHPVPAHLHDLRVALARLRFSQRLTKPWLDTPARLRRDLAWLGRALGKVRDLDVVLQTSRDWARAAGPQAAAAGGALQVLRQQRQESLRRLARRFSSPRGRSVATQVLGLTDRHLRPTASSTEPFADRFPDLLRRTGRRVRRWRRRGVTEFDRAELHRLRIAFKHLRYLCELLLPLCPELAPYRRRWRAYQDALGAMRDADLAVRKLRRIGRETSPQPHGTASRQALQDLIAWHGARARAAAREFSRLWAGLPGEWKRWKRVRRGLRPVEKAEERGAEKLTGAGR